MRSYQFTFGCKKQLDGRYQQCCIDLNHTSFGKAYEEAIDQAINLLGTKEILLESFASKNT